MHQRSHKTHKKYRRKGQSLIASNKIKPEEWEISNAEAKHALKAQGCKVKEIKKIRCLKHQVCISYWDEKGGVCSGFFSYRIFTKWQVEVEKLVNACQSLKEWVLLDRIMKYEFACYPYLKDMEDVLRNALKNCLYILETSVLLQAV
ncbi:MULTISPECIES: hypothetical protein [Nostocales]|uniref:Uncharacterized protein n=3 Tax=Nostocales TaxID=1161 RepID=A0A0C1QYG1_9CYAN|nr:hypothetical protein [Tolypothrix bouteillei]KAF3885631.1 hypothetical protein DA73_0400009260 [Tolypothrix bouteillei VB521301]